MIVRELLTVRFMNDDKLTAKKVTRLAPSERLPSAQSAQSLFDDSRQTTEDILAAITSILRCIARTPSLPFTQDFVLVLLRNRDSCSRPDRYMVVLSSCTMGVGAF